MKRAIMHRISAVLLAAGLGSASAVSVLGSGPSEQTLPLLRTKTATYTNVTITARNETHLCIVHSGGVGNVLFEDIEPQEYAAVGYVPPVPAREKFRSMANEQASKMIAALPWETTPSGAQPETLQLPPVPPSVIGALIAVAVLFHLFFSYCAMLICRKAGTDPGLLVWLPVLQMIPMFRAAGMSGWWLLAMPLPIVGLVVGIVWCFKLVSARGKSPVWGVLMLLPLANLLSFLYLAFSAGETEDAEETAPPRLPGLSVRAA